MRINLNSTNYLNTPAFKSKFTENSKQDLYKIAKNDPVSVYGTIQMAKNDRKNNVLLLRESETFADGYDLLTFEFDNKAKKYDNFKDCNADSSDHDPILYSLYCPDEIDWDYHNGYHPYVSSEKIKKLNNKYEKELIKISNCTELTEQIKKTNQQLQKIKRNLNELENKRYCKMVDYVKSVIDKEATVTGDVFDSFLMKYND